MKKIIVTLLLILLSGGAVACTSDTAPPTYFFENHDDNDGIPTPAPTVVYASAPSEELRHSFGLDSPGLSNIFLDLDAGDSGGDPVVMYMSQSIEGGSSTPPHEPNPDGEAAVESVQRMIVRTGEISLVVEDVEKAVDDIGSMAESYEGYVVSAESWQEGERMVGNISIRVGAAYYQNAINDLRDMAVEVKSQSTSGKDVTEEYVDLNATLGNLEASEEQLLDLMDQAGTVEEILEVQKELAKTRENIEKTSGRMQYLEQSSATSLININLEHSLLAVEFTAYSRVVKEGEKVWFRADVSGGFPPYSYEWDFGDGNKSTDEQPYHEYRSDETFTVILTVTDDRGNTDTNERSGYITVLPGWSFNSVVSGVWDGIVVFGKILLNILIGIVISSPVWIVILLILYFVWWRPRKKRKKKRMEDQNSVQVE